MATFSYQAANNIKKVTDGGYFLNNRIYWLDINPFFIVNTDFYNVVCCHKNISL